MTQIITSRWWGGAVWAYKYKWSVNSYNDLPSSWMKVWDVYNVVNAHTTDPKFPAWSNLAWTGTEWDVLWGNIDLSDYQKKLVEWEWIDLDQDTNEISVESSIISWAAAWATSVQPWDLCAVATSWKYCDLSWTPTLCTVATSGKYCDLSWTPSLCPVATTGKYCDLTWTPTIWNAKLTIQRNGTCINAITMNASADVTANISVPTQTSDLSNNSWFITKDVANLTNYTPTTSLCAVATSGKYCDLSGTPDLSGYQTKGCMVCSLSWADDSHYPTAKTVADALSCAGAGDMMKSVYDPCNCNKDAFNYNNMYNKPAIINSLCCTSTTDALSANQWKALKDLIDTYVWLWRFLSLWNSSTGQPISFPLSTPYTYKTWDWYMVEVTWATNYMPNWSSYTWSASTTVDSVNNVEVRDVYIYDGTDWLFQKNNEVQVSFADVAWVPTDNACLCAALDAKQDTLTAWANINITSNKVKATNVYTVKESDTCTTYTWTLWVAPYNTSYCYTNICINPDSWVEWHEWGIYSFDIDTWMVATSACRNVRVKIWDGEYIPVMWTSSILAWCAYFTKANTRQYMYSTKYQSCWALHLFTDSNTTYSTMWTTEIDTWTCTSARTITAANLKYAIQHYSPTDNCQLANSCGYVTASVNNLSNYTLSSCLCTVATSGKYCDLTWTPTIPTCVSELSNDSWFTTCTGTLVSWDNITCLSNNAWYTTCTGTISTCSQIISTLWYTPYNSTNPNWYTSCTWTLSTCADVISALGYTPYNSTNPSGYTTCTGTLVAWDLTVVSWDTWCVYTIKKSTTAPSWAGSNTITLVTE